MCGFQNLIMKKHLYLYLFIFASLIALIFYINGRKYQEKLESQVTQLRKELAEEKDAQKDVAIEEMPADDKVFNFLLDNNPEAEDYLYNAGLTTDFVKQQVTDQLLSLNLQEGGNSLISYTGENRGFQINSTLFVNHKWVLVNFYDGQRWGEALIEYNFDADKNLELNTVKELLYL